MDSSLTQGVPKVHPRGEDVVSCNYEKVFSDILLPGSGEKPGRCAGWFPTKFCPECGRPHLAKGNCKRIVCPDCSTEWRYARVEKVLERFLSFKWDNDKRIRHFVISPSPDRVGSIESSRDILDLFGWAYDVAKSHGAGGGMVIFHPYRLKPDKKSELRAIAKKEDSWSPGEFHLWKTLVKLDNWEDYVYFYPHFHVLATTDKGSNFKAGGDGSEVWKGVSELSTPEAVLKCSMYLLSHTGSFVGLDKQVQVIRWFGNLAPCNWSLKKASESVKEKTEVKVEKLVGEFGEGEDVGFLECSECGSSLLDICKAPDYFDCDKFSDERKLLLRNAWRWRNGMIPPPARCRDLPEGEVLERLKEVSRADEHKGSLEDVEPGRPEGEPRFKVPDRVKEARKERVKDRSPEKLDFYDCSSKPRFYGRDSREKGGLDSA